MVVSLTNAVNHPIKLTEPSGGDVQLAEVPEFVARRRVPLNTPITHRFRVDQAAEVYRPFGGLKTGKVVPVWP